MATNGKIKILFELGAAVGANDWPDYLQYGFSPSDVPALLELVADQSLHQAPDDSKELWAPLHAWRTLGQIGSAEAARPLIALFDLLVEDDWALSELSQVMGMIGEAALEPLAAHMNEVHHDEFSRVMAVDALAEIVKCQPQCRARVIQCYRQYMRSPDISSQALNSLLLGHLLDLDAKEAIDDIRRLFEMDCIDISFAGDIEDVEIEFGFRSERSTPKADLSQSSSFDSVFELVKPDSDDVLEGLDYYLLRYGHDDSILDVSELDGFFAALACAPETIMPSTWMPAIWGGDAQTPQWFNESDCLDFSQSAMALYNHVMQSFMADDFEPIFLERRHEGQCDTIVDEWCDGFLRGIELWAPLDAQETLFMQECVQPLSLFVTDAGYLVLNTLSEDEVVAQQRLIEHNVRRLYQHFLAQRQNTATPLTHNTPKVGRNELCPCGSGKKYKKCCMH